MPLIILQVPKWLGCLNTPHRLVKLPLPAIGSFRRASLQAGIASYRFLVLSALFPDSVNSQGTDPGGRKQQGDQEDEQIGIIPCFGV